MKPLNATTPRDATPAASRTCLRLSALASTSGAQYSSRMKTVTLTARFDGERIQLDEPFALPSNARLLVTILPEFSADAEREQWYALSKAGLARAYSDDEPDYPATLVSKHASP